MFKSNTRDNNFDLLRIICTIAVIAIHVGLSYPVEEVGISWCLYCVLTRFAVPCFVMLSGAFTLADSRNKNYKYFYKKTFIKIGIPTILFSLFYALFSIFCSIKSTQNDISTEIFSALKSLIKGSPYYHFWYLYMFIGIYLVVPIILRTKDDIGEKMFSRVAWVLLPITTIGGYEAVHHVNWDFGLSVSYLGYFLIGYVIRQYSISHKPSNARALIFITFGFFIEILISHPTYYEALGTPYIMFPLSDPLSPFIAIASVLIFTGFSYLNLSFSLSKLSSLTFLIYLSHEGILIILKNVVYQKLDIKLEMPLYVLIVFVLSIIFSILYHKIWKYFDNKTSFSERLCRLMNLS